MKRNHAFGWGLALLAAQALAQQQPQPQAARKDDVKVAQAGDSRCRKDVKDYVDTLRFVRQTAGAQIGDKVAGGFISEPELDKVVATQGHCAAAQLLRDKGTPR